MDDRARHDAFLGTLCSNCHRPECAEVEFCDQILDCFSALRHNGQGDTFTYIRRTNGKVEIRFNEKLGYGLITPEEGEFYMKRLGEMYGRTSFYS